MVELKNCYYRYPGKKMLLKDISFSLDKNEIMAVLGKNGTGKTTMLKCLTGILKWEKGQTFIDGKSINLKDGMNEIGYVPQGHNLPFPYTVSEMISMGRAKHIGIFSMPSKRDMIKVDEIIEEIGIQDLKDCSCTELSGGQLQLVYIARALVSNPKLLILDEPESHLDFKNQLMVMKLIRRLADEKDLACIINTHYPDHALKISDKTLLLGDGNYLTGNTNELITEDNIKKYFDVDAKIISYVHENMNLRTIVAV